MAVAGRDVAGGVGSAKYRERRCLRINNNQFDFCPFCDLYFICLFLDENSTKERGRKESSANHEITTSNLFFVYL